jgi:hypothetical protein
MYGIHSVESRGAPQRGRPSVCLLAIPFQGSADLIPSSEGGEMSERDGYEPSVPCWVATIQPDPDAAAAFYGELFGWDYEDGGGFGRAPLGRDVAAVAPLLPGVDRPRLRTR